MDARQLTEAGHLLARRHGDIHRIVGILEPLQVPIALMREALDVVGTRAAVADLFRDKGRMKDELRRHGLPCARHRMVADLQQAREFAAVAGYPVVIKPAAGMGCKSTWRVTSDEELVLAVAASHISEQRPAIMEEFLVGNEYSLETITIGGEPVFLSASRYLPTPLEVMENPWIQWAVLHPRSIVGPEFDDARDLGVRAVKALGLETGFTHMEWFRRRDGSLAIGEIAARPPGAQIVSCNNYVHDADLHRAWARAVVDDAFDGPWERKYAVGAVFLRGMGAGRVRAIDGLAQAQQHVVGLVVEARLPTVGTISSDSYEGDGCIIVRHPDTDTVRRAINAILNHVRIRYA
jgi:biotin carboxylase